MYVCLNCYLHSDRFQTFSSKFYIVRQALIIPCLTIAMTCIPNLTSAKTTILDCGFYKFRHDHEFLSSSAEIFRQGQWISWCQKNSSLDLSSYAATCITNFSEKQVIDCLLWDTIDEYAENDRGQYTTTEDDRFCSLAKAKGLNVADGVFIQKQNFYSFDIQAQSFFQKENIRLQDSFENFVIISPFESLLELPCKIN